MARLGKITDVTRVPPLVAYVKVHWIPKSQTKPYPVAYFTSTPIRVNLWLLEDNVRVRPTDLVKLGEIASQSPCASNIDTTGKDYLEIEYRLSSGGINSCLIKDKQDYCSTLRALDHAKIKHLGKDDFAPLENLMERVECPL